MNGASTPGSNETIPQFSNPTTIINPFFPVSTAKQAIELGTESGERVRNEVTLLPEIRPISIAGTQIDTRVVQFVGYAGSHLIEVAYDHYAQADDGSVYYFGEDVTTYKNGHIDTHEGTWLAGRDGAPPGLIMPNDPTVGKVFRSENRPGLVFETDTVMSRSEKTMTPRGSISDGLLIREKLMEGTTEYKVYAKGIGVVEERANDAQINLVLFNTTDQAIGTVPKPLRTIEARAVAIFDIASKKQWEKIDANVMTVTSAWNKYQSPTEKTPQPFNATANEAIQRLKKAHATQEVAATQQAANDVAKAVLDVISLYNPAVPADIGRLGVFERQLVLDLSIKNEDAASDSLATVSAIWARIREQTGSTNAAAAEYETSVIQQVRDLEAHDTNAVLTEATNALSLIYSMAKGFQTTNVKRSDGQ